MTKFDLRAATLLRQERMSAQAIAEKLTASGTSVSASTVRRKLINNDTWRIPDDGRLMRHYIRVHGQVHKGFGYAAFRRYAYRLEDGEWRRASSKPTHTAFRWPACPQTNAAGSAAMAALAGLLYVPQREPAIIQAPDDVLELLSQHASAPESPVLPEAAALLFPALPGLRQATLQPSAPAHEWGFPRQIVRLTPEWVGSRRNHMISGSPGRFGQALDIPSTEPAVGSWVSDFSHSGSGTDGVAAFYRLTPFPLSCTPVFTMRLHVKKTVEGELIAALLAHIYARVTGETKPVVHSDCQNASVYLLRDLDQLTHNHANLYLTLLGCLPTDEVRALDMRWTRRGHDAIKHADSAARALMCPDDTTARLTKARELAITLQPGQVANVARAFFQKELAQ